MSCGCGKPKCDGKCGISPAVLQINNNDCTLFHKVEVPAAMGDETTNPPKNGAYRNVLLYYAASGNSYLYSSDGIPTKLTGVVSDYEVLTNKPSINDVVLIGNKTLADLGITSAIDNAVGAEASARTEADNALSDRINSNASSISSVSARVSANTTAINNEKTARENADTALSDRINAVKDTADSAVQPDDIDYTVMMDVDVSANSSTSMVELEGSKVNLKTGITSSKQVPLPVASSTEAGVMNSSTFDAVTSNTSNINAILSGAVAITGLSANPTQAQLTTAWQNETGLSTLINRASIYDVTNSKVWTYYTNDTTWHATESASTITINQFTNSSLGTIKGSTNVGQIFAENDGTGSVNGWDSLSSTVTNATNKLSGIQDGAEVNVQSDWEVTDNTSDAFIKNKPTIPTKTSQLENDSGFIVNDTHQVCSEGGDITLDGTTLEPLVFNHLSGETSQTTYTGKNLLKYPYKDTTVTRNGVKFTDNGDGTITVSETATADAMFWLTNETWAYSTNNTVIPAGTYTVSKTGKSYATIFVTVYGKTQGQIGTFNASTSDATFTTTEEASLTVRLKIDLGATGNGLVISPQIEAGSTATSFEPYVGGVASPNPEYPQAVNTTTGENVVRITGKNLFNLGTNLDDYFVTNENGTKIPSNQSKDFVSATLTGTKWTTDSYNTTGWKWCSKWVPLNKNTDYTIKITQGTDNIRVIGFPSKEIGATGTSIARLSGGVATFNSGNYAYYAVSIYPNTAGSVYENIQLELGSTATAYEPYQGQSYEVNLGKNLLNPTGISSTPVSYAGVNVSLQSDGTILLDGTATGDEWVNIMSGDFTTAVYSITSIGQTTVSLTQADGTLSASVSNGAVARVIHDNLNGYWAFFIQSGASYNNAVLKIQFEKGSTATDFAAYFDPIELCKIGTYQDYIYKSGDKWYKHKAVGKVVYNGTEDWQIYNGFMFLYEPSFILSYGDNGYMPTNYLADNFTRNSLDNALSDRDASYLVQNVWGERDKQRGVAMATNSTFADLSAWKTWLGSHNTTIYYQLDNPTEEEITNQALVGQLEALWEADGVEGQTNIFSIYADGNEQMQISVCQYPSHLPIATTSQLGTVIVGHGLTIEEDGKLDVVVDDALSATSIHPVENRAVYEAIEGLSPYTAGNHIDITDNTISAVDYVHSENPVSITTPGSTVSGSELTDGSVTFDKTATGEFLKLQLTTTDPGEGAALADNTLLGVYQ